MSKIEGSADTERMASMDLHPQSSRKLRWLWLFAGLILALLLVFGRWNAGKTTEEVRYKTAPAQRGDLTVLVTATGNLQPTNQVLVGIEVSGTIKSVEVEHNDFVKAGQLLARLDTTKLEARILQSQAVLESAEAGLLRAQAGFHEAGQVMERLRRIRQSSDGRLPSIQDFDAAVAALQRAKAEKALSEAGIAEAKAKLQSDKIDLEKAVVLSPIDGVVLKRSAEPGQTVAASFQSPELFTLAENLTQMELQVNVDEADVGQVQTGQAATFTVDAYPERTFPARITQVRYGSQVNQGVVTYLTILNVDNGDLALRPGMTATADIVVKKIKDGLLVPSAALRFTPALQEAKEEGAASGSLVSKLFPRFRGTRPGPRQDGTGKGEQRVWVLADKKPMAVPVTIGATSGLMTEVVTGEIDSGRELIIEAISGKNSKRP